MPSGNTCRYLFLMNILIFLAVPVICDRLAADRPFLPVATPSSPAYRPPAPTTMPAGRSAATATAFRDRSPGDVPNTAPPHNKILYNTNRPTVTNTLRRLPPPPPPLLLPTLLLLQYTRDRFTISLCHFLVVPGRVPWRQQGPSRRTPVPASLGDRIPTAAAGDDDQDGGGDVVKPASKWLMPPTSPGLIKILIFGKKKFFNKNWYINKFKKFFFLENKNGFILSTWGHSPDTREFLILEVEPRARKKNNNRRYIIGIYLYIYIPRAREKVTTFRLRVACTRV